jgi:hypothetical protein
VPALETELRQPQLGRGQAGREDDIVLVLKARLQLPYPGSGTGDSLVEEQHIVMMRRRGSHSLPAPSASLFLAGTIGPTQRPVFYGSIAF